MFHLHVNRQSRRDLDYLKVGDECPHNFPERGSKTAYLCTVNRRDAFIEAARLGTVNG